MRRVLALLLTTVALAPPVLAQEKLELSPFLGVRTAGSFRGEDQLVQFKVGSSLTFGTFVDYLLTDQLAVEFLWSHQGSTLDKETVMIGVEPTGAQAVPSGEGQAEASVPVVPDGELFNIGIDYLHGGIRFDGGNEQFKPYVAAGLGTTTLRPDFQDAPNVTKFSFSIGTGLNAHVTDRIGFRAEVRAFGTRTGDQQEDLACGVFGCVSFERSATFWQSHFVGAVIVKF